MVTVWLSAAHLIHYSFLNPSEIITSENYAQQINEIHWKLHCLRPALVNERVQFSSMISLTTHCTINTSKVEWIGPRPSHSPDLSPTDYYFFKHLNNFLHGKPFHNQQETENVFQEFVKSRGMDFYTTGINKLISHWQKCVDCVMVLILTNKDVFEPSYNDLKFTVWNHN